MHIKRSIVLFGISVLISSFLGVAHAQVQGTVIDAETRLPVRDASIVIVSSQVGTNSSRIGTFFLDWITFPVQLRISAIGYETRTLTVFQRGEQLVVVLNPKIYLSDEVLIADDRVDTRNVRTRPLPVTVITSAQSQTQPSSSSVDLLRSQKGVYVQQTTPGQGSVYIRGRAGRDVLYLFNGLRMNPSFVRSGQNQYFGAIDPLTVGQINVMRGPVSVYYGSDALSGGVNVVPVLPSFSSDSGISGKTKFIGNIGGTGERSGNVQLSYQSPRFAAFAAGTFRDFQYYRMSSRSSGEIWYPYDTRMDIAAYRYHAYHGAARYRINSENQLEFVTMNGYLPEAARIDQMILGYSRQVDPDIRYPAMHYSSNTAPLQFSAHSLRWKSILTHSWFNSLNLVIGYHHLKDHRKEIPFVQGYTTFTPVDFSSQLTVFPITHYDRSTSNMYLGSFDITSLPNPSTIIRFGGELSIDNVNSWRYNQIDNLSSTDRNRTYRLPRYPHGSTYCQTGAFVHVTHNLSPVIWLEAGLRYSFIFADLKLEGSDSERGFNPITSQYKFTTGSMGLTWSPERHLYITGNLSTGFRAPNIADLSELGVRRSRFIQVPNPTLDGEKTINADVSLRWINNIVNVEVTGFAVYYFDKIESVMTGNVHETFSDGANRTYIEVMNRNENKMRLYGIESSVDYEKGSWRSGLVFNLTHGELEKRGGGIVPVDRIPPANGQVYLGYTVNTRLDLQARMRYAFAQRRLSELELQDYRISNEGTDGFYTFQVSANLKISDNSTLNMLADNLTDRPYREHGSTLDGLGRNLTVRYTYTF